MAYKNFYAAVLLRLIVIIMLSIAGAFLYFEKQAIILCFVALILLIVAVINIIRYFNNINQWIALFLLGIENDDASLKAPSKTGNKAIDNVFIGIERLNDLFKKTKIDISTQEQYYRSVINQSATGLFSVNEKGRVININPAAVKLTSLHEYHHVNALISIDSALSEFIMHPKENYRQQSAIFENKYGQKLLFKLSEIKTAEEIIKLVAVSDITKELDNGEVDAWIKLARTLSHEIMNNIAPITTLSNVILNYFTKNNKIIEATDLDSKIIGDTIKGLNVIEERSLSLMNFVNNYRKFTKLPSPKLKEVNLSNLIENNLVAAGTFPGFNEIKLEKHIPENLMFITDENLLSLVLINLLKNACEAIIFENKTNPKIIIKLQQTKDTTKVEITNNGPNIPPEIKEQIFIPFFTTKDEGSGIGLSLSKQIMLKMNGDILLNSAKDKPTTFSVILN
ncbi:MAG: GHKL domain-containing protein [Bacteroidales bacterium]|nr:GHKL domain-containing protein [Bacteroidales bacterium]